MAHRQPPVVGTDPREDESGDEIRVSSRDFDRHVATQRLPDEYETVRGCALHERFHRGDCLLETTRFVGSRSVPRESGAAVRATSESDSICGTHVFREIPAPWTKTTTGASVGPRLSTAVIGRSSSDGLKRVSQPNSR